MLSVTILHEYKSWTHKSYYRWDHDAVVCCDNRSDSICPSPGTNPWFFNWHPQRHNWAYSMLYRWCDTGGAALPSTLRRIYTPLLFDRKILIVYSTALLSSLCVTWLTEAFWHYFASSIVVSWQLFCHIGQLHRVFSSHWSWHIFFHNIGSVVQWCSVFSVTQAGHSEKIGLWSCCRFWSTSPTLGIVLSRFLSFFLSP